MITTLPIDMFITGVLLIIAVGLGRNLINLTGLRFASKGKYLLFCAGTGLVVMSYLFLIMGYMGLLYPIVFYGLICLALIFLYKTIRKTAREVWPRVKGFYFAKRDGTARVILLVLVIAVVSNIVFNHAPLTDTDELIYHVSVPRIYIDAHGIIDIPDNWTSYFPLAVEMLYGYGIILGDGITAKMISYSFGILCLLIVYFFTKELFSPRIALLAAMLFYLSPPVTNAAGIANVDVPRLFFSMLALWAYISLIRSGDSAWILMMSLMAGMSAASKVSDAVLVFTLFILLTYYYFSVKTSVADYLKRACLFWSIVAALLLPWMLKNYFQCGNPFPFMLMSFPGLDFPVSDMVRLHMSERFSGFASLQNISIRGVVTFTRKLFLGGYPTLTPSPAVWAFGLPVLFFSRNASVRRMKHFILMYFLLMVFLLPQTSMATYRYYFLVYAVITIMSAYGIIQAIRKIIPARRIILAFVIIPVIFPCLVFNLYFSLKRAPLFMGLQKKQDYLRAEYGEIDSFGLVGYVNNNIGKGKKIVSIGRMFAFQYYFRSRITAAQPELMRMDSRDAVMRYLGNRGIDYIAFYGNEYKDAGIRKGGVVLKSRKDRALDMFWKPCDFEPAYFNTVYSNRGVVLYKVKNASQ